MINEKQWLSLLSQSNDCNKYFHWNTSPLTVGYQKSGCRIAECLEHGISEVGLLKMDEKSLAISSKEYRVGHTLAPTYISVWFFLVSFMEWFNSTSCPFKEFGDLSRKFVIFLL